MKRLMMIWACVVAIALGCQAQNRWKVYGGGSLSHLCEKPWISSDKSYGWGGGAFLGGGYEVNFNSHWSLTPALELAFDNNGATLDSPELDFYANHALWNSIWSLNIPILANFRFAVSENNGLGIGVGPYLREALAGRHYTYDSERKTSMSGNFSNRFNFGVMGEVAFETGRHFYYMFRVRYPFLKEGWERKTINLSLGIGYTF